MKKIILVLCVIFNVVAALAYRQGAVGFDRPTFGLARTRVQAVTDFKGQNKDRCPKLLSRFNRLYHVEQSQNGLFAVTQDAAEDCDAEAAAQE